RPAAAPQAASSVPEPAGESDDRERELGLLLFEAEEALARGAAEKAVVLASKAVKDRPDSLTARALHERARRELLRGRRRERLEERVREAEALLAGGDAAGAERIVTSALKLIPSHPVALALFTRLKERRQQAPTAEAWAEQVLERGKAGQHAVQAQVRAGLDLLGAGELDESLKVLRAVLRADPDNERAQVAVQQ